MYKFFFLRKKYKFKSGINKIRFVFMKYLNGIKEDKFKSVKI